MFPDLYWILTKVDPRACGVNLGKKYLSTKREGRSPRMRGKPVFKHSMSLILGSIPAHAG